MPDAVKGLQLTGELSLTFSRRKNRTFLRSLHQTSPLKASHALYPEEEGHAVVYLMETSGGMVSGDHNSYNIIIEESSRVTLIQQSALKVYPSRNGRCTKQTMKITVENNAFVKLDPDTIIPFENARFQSKTEIQLSSFSHFLWGEILSAGRREKGEHYQYQEIDLLTSISKNGKLCAYDRFRFQPETAGYEEIGLLDGYSYYASVWAASETLDKQQLLEVSEAVAEANSAVTEVEKGIFCFRWLSNDLVDLKKHIRYVMGQITIMMETAQEGDL
ncbi:urease accessory protein UreD [Alteribacillus sp. HJP-4]|uniref:urease accessory protein UreD n=1 Tax=Alteribacillus sp. HJP-4 TaxID=2775394 RepID=UPI0035CD0E28